MRKQRRVLFIALASLLFLTTLAMVGPLSGMNADAEPSGLEPVVGNDPVPTTVRSDSVSQDTLPESLPGAIQIMAMAASYPERITEVGIVDGEWALRMDDRWYFWADGRLLPDEFREQADLYVPIRFYRYELGPLEPRVITQDLARTLEARTEQRSSAETDTRERFNDFLDTLYRIRSRADAERIVRRIEFLGFATRVHPLLVDPLARVERTIRALIPHDPEVAASVERLSGAHGYNWRTIAGTVRRSYHSYGIAVDLVPRSYRGQWPYWLWAAQGGIARWWELPIEQRWYIPQPVIDAFEEQGFIWGGKWLFFDNLHFEYRPESTYMAKLVGQP